METLFLGIAKNKVVWKFKRVIEKEKKILQIYFDGIADNDDTILSEASSKTDERKFDGLLFAEWYLDLNGVWSWLVF